MQQASASSTSDALRKLDETAVKSFLDVIQRLSTACEAWLQKLEPVVGVLGVDLFNAPKQLGDHATSTALRQFLSQMTQELQAKKDGQPALDIATLISFCKSLKLLYEAFMRDYESYGQQLAGTEQRALIGCWREFNERYNAWLDALLSGMQQPTRSNTAKK